CAPTVVPVIGATARPGTGHGQERVHVPGGSRGAGRPGGVTVGAPRGVRWARRRRRGGSPQYPSRPQERRSRPHDSAPIHVGGPHCGGRVAHTTLPGVAQGTVIRAGGPAALLRVSPPPQGAVPSMRRSVVLSAAVAGVAALFTAACSSPGSSTASGDKEVEVALITSTSGPLASYGEQYLQGFEAGLDHATDGTGRVDGIKI